MLLSFQSLLNLFRVRERHQQEANFKIQKTFSLFRRATSVKVFFLSKFITFYLKKQNRKLPNSCSRLKLMLK